MKIKKLNARGFSHELLAILFVIIFAVSGTAYVVATHAATPTVPSQFSGTITQDECATTTAPVGDVGCHLTVDNTKIITVAHGNIIQTKPWGQVINFATLRTNYVGRQVQVYAAMIDSTHYTLKGSASYYVRLVLPTTAQFSGTITQDECATTTAPLGDVGCHITVGNTNVTVAHGNIAQTQPWGQVINFATLRTNYVGRQVQVYAAVVDLSNDTLKGSASYYVRLLPVSGTLPGSNCVPKPGYVCPG